ncbi:MFS general substrate transporter [Paraphaeosphaeria sporulosa]|uniref:MFS general substrate transporter n=1 Tax=Paraphaeosphaeria sporulosa TaxID=1460663 RepID=A0A177CQM4_9PLEO|nr:MFS general substrate transporter [Paraphaeosphaeria sporulosa]OAG09823.1 MFS general substrate transporter [Paraphaeosphaeria sporulosa]
MERKELAISHHENNDNSHKSQSSSVDDAHLYGFAADESTIRKGYFRSPRFLGTMLATGLGLSVAVGGFGLAAPNLALINNEIGPDPNISWVSLVYTLTLAIGLLLVGRLSDLFGRRWFFIGAAGLSLIGCVVSATAQNVQALIAGTAIIGLAASGQQSFATITGELVPMKHRFAANAVMYVFCIPFSALAPALSKAFVLYSAAGWRWCYYLMIILSFISGLLFFIFYFPPTFEDKFKNKSRGQQIRDFDYIGTVLFIGGFVIFLLGLSWGGSVYPWKSAHVISTMVVGGLVLIAFALWECFAPLKEPLLPMHLFKNVAWVVACVLLGIGAMIYYAMAIVWPSMVAVLYTDDGGASMYAGWLSCMPGMINGGQIVGGFLAVPIGKTRIQVIVVLILGGSLLAAIAYAGPDDLWGAGVLMVLSSFFIGWNESVCLSNAGIELLNQQEIGTAIGAAGSIRSAISSLGSAVYVSVLSNRLLETIPAKVPAAVVQAGLPESSVAGFMAGLTSGSFTDVSGLTPDIISAGMAAYKSANAQAYRTVFLATIAFTGLAVILSFFAPNVDDKMTGQIAVTLHREDDDGKAEKVDGV